MEQQSENIVWEVEGSDCIGAYRPITVAEMRQQVAAGEGKGDDDGN